MLGCDCRNLEPHNGEISTPSRNVLNWVLKKIAERQVCKNYLEFPLYKRRSRNTKARSQCLGLPHVNKVRLRCNRAERKHGIAAAKSERIGQCRPYRHIASPLAQDMIHSCAISTNFSHIGRGWDSLMVERKRGN